MGATDNCCFILSAGRTGTVSLAQLLARHLPECLVVHEPFPARYEMVLGNIRNATGFGDAALRRLFLSSRSARLRSDCYVEINPFLSPITDLLLLLPVPLNVVHVVREPISWSRSIATFRASPPLRGIIDFVPFAKPYPNIRPANWSDLAEVDRALWRWRFCNERIAELRHHCQRYKVIRYEDLFADTPARRQSAFANLASVLPMTLHSPVPQTAMAVRTNQSPPQKGTAQPDPALARLVCGELASSFGYTEI